MGRYEEVERAGVGWGCEIVFPSAGVLINIVIVWL